MYNQDDLSKIFKSKNYEELVKKNNFNTIAFLLEEGMEFTIVTYTNIIEFDPPVPKSVVEFDRLTIFSIAAYTLESATVDKDNLFIEAGFGSDNFGSHLKIPLEAIHQIAVDDTILAVSYFKPINKKKILEQIDSMSILLNNPENLKLLNKRKRNKN